MSDLLKPLLIVHKSFESNRAAYDLLASHFRLKTSTSIESNSVISNEVRLAVLFVELNSNNDVTQLTSKVFGFVQSHYRARVMFYLSSSGRDVDAYRKQREQLERVYERIGTKLIAQSNRSIVVQLYEDLSEALIDLVQVLNMGTNVESMHASLDENVYKSEVRKCMKMVLELANDDNLSI